MTQQFGLHDAEFERASCGVGFVVNIQGKRSHAIVEDGLRVLNNLMHRGATGADPNTGTGRASCFKSRMGSLERFSMQKASPCRPPGITP